MKWTRWKSILLGSEYQGPAVYMTRLVLDGQPMTIPRFLKNDQTGIILIGNSNNMERRRRQFCTGLSRGEGHSEANLLFILKKYTKVKSILDRYKIEYRFMQLSTKNEATQCEEILIKRYVKRFGEVPPLNSTIPKRYHIEAWTKS